MKFAYLAVVGSILCGSSAAQSCDYQVFKEKLSAQLRTLRTSKSPFESTYLAGHCSYLQAVMLNGFNQTAVPSTELVAESLRCGDEKYADILSKSTDPDLDPTQYQVLCNQLFASSGLGDVFAGQAIRLCDSAISWQLEKLCTIPPECPTPNDRGLLTPLNDCTLDAKQPLGSEERDDYVNANEDAECVQNAANNPCDPLSATSARVFDECKISTSFIVFTLKGSTLSCRDGFAPKSERCDQDIGTVIREMCEYKKEEEGGIIIIAAGAGGGAVVLIIIGVYFVFFRGKSSKDTSATPYGKQDQFGQGFSSPPMVGAYPASSAGNYPVSSAGGMMSNHAPSVASGYNAPSMSPYGAGAMPGSSPYGTSVSGAGHRAPGASGGAMVPSGKYLGVMRNNATGVWVAEFRDNGVNEYLGQFDTEDEAARAYDIRALQVKGSAVELNFPFGSAGPSGGLGLQGLKVGGMPPPMPGRGMGGSQAGSVAGGSVAGGPTTASLKEQLTQFYNFHDPGRPNISGHVDRLFEKYRFVNIARAVKAKYQRLPPGWEEELARRGESADPSGSASTLTRPPGL